MLEDSRSAGDANGDEEFNHEGAVGKEVISGVPVGVVEGGREL